jgi:hypothetical protein
LENLNDNTEQEKQEVASSEQQEAQKENSIPNNEDQKQQQDSSNTQESQVEETQEQINWRKVREKREQDRIAQEEALKKSQQKDQKIAELTELIQSIQPNQNTNLTKEQEQKVIADLLDEDIPTGGEVKNFLKQYIPNAVNEILKQQSAEQEKRRQEEERQNLGSNLQKKHTDFYNVVNEDNIAYLDYHYPEVSEALTALPEGVNKWSKIYSTVKKLVPSNSDNSTARIERNMNKPQPGAISSSSPSAEMSIGKSLTEAQKAENYKRLLDLARRS